MLAKIKEDIVNILIPRVKAKYKKYLPWPPLSFKTFVFNYLSCMRRKYCRPELLHSIEPSTAFLEEL